MGLMVSSADREAAAVEAFRRYALHLDHVAARRAAGAADIVWVGLDVNGYLGTESNN